jgi:hypothetical protein
MKILHRNFPCKVPTTNRFFHAPTLDPKAIFHVSLHRPPMLQSNLNLLEGISKIMRRNLLFVLSFLCFFLASTLHAQQVTAAITGKAVDAI